MKRKALYPQNTEKNRTLQYEGNLIFIFIDNEFLLRR